MQQSASKKAPAVAEYEVVKQWTAKHDSPKVGDKVKLTRSQAEYPLAAGAIKPYVAKKTKKAEASE